MATRKQVLQSLLDLAKHTNVAAMGQSEYGYFKVMPDGTAYRMNERGEWQEDEQNG